MASALFAAFLEELRLTLPLSPELLLRLWAEVVSSAGLLTLSLAILCGVLASVVWATSEHNLLAKATAELLALVMAIAPALMPFKAVRFGMGLYLFASFLSVHSRILSPGNSDESSGSALKQVSQTFFANLQPKLGRGPCRLPSLARLAYSLTELLLLDGVLFLLQEVVPTKVSPANRFAATALVGGVWVLVAMDLFYSNLIILLQLLGFPIPMQLRHRHPLLSTSLSEFWGTRWNPIICRLLQDSFYKPLRHLGLPRLACVIACFAGSAILHAWPQYASTFSASDAALTFLFFFGQGLLLSIELLATHLWRRVFPTDSEEKNKADAYTRAGFQWLVELNTVCGLLAFFYVTLERPASGWSNLCLSGVILISVVLGILFFLFEVQGPSLFRHPGRTLFSLLGWMWAVGSVVLMLPLFSIPVYHALGTMYDRSYFIGPLVRTLIRAYSEQDWTKEVCLQIESNFSVNATRAIL